MMILRRLFGILLAIAAVTGFIFSAAGIYEIWRIRPAVTHTVVENLVFLDQALITTHDGLIIAGQVLQTTTTDVASLQTITDSLALAIHDTNPMLDSLANLTSKDFPAAIIATQTSLDSAQSSALLIDNVLEALTSIPLISVTPYKSATGLHTALAQVSTSLNSVTSSMVTINTSLSSGKTNLGTLEGELSKISETTQAISTSLGGAQAVIEQYKTTTTQLKAKVETAQRMAPTWITTVTWILSFVLGWLLIVQLGLLAQGVDMLRGRREAV
jgi:hypothetical protein